MSGIKTLGQEPAPDFFGLNHESQRLGTWLADFAMARIRPPGMPRLTDRTLQPRRIRGRPERMQARWL